MLVDQHILHDVRFVDIWHNRKYADSRWQLIAVDVIEHVQHRLYQFPCKRWLGTDEENPVRRARAYINPILMLAFSAYARSS